MALVFNNRNNLQGQPGFHALIAGVSLYRHLPGGGGPLAEEDWGLPQLTATALTGYKIYRWLIDHRQQLPVKLATVRLLLSPSATEVLEIEKGMKEIREGLANEGVTLQDSPSPCNLANFSAEARDWWRDAQSDNGNITFFYFAGHGVQRMNSDSVLLLEDFGNPAADLLTNAVAFDKLFAGMVPPANPQKQIARTQLYFIDACRVIPPELGNYEFRAISNILTGELGGVDNRTAPIFFGTVSNKKAYAKSGQQTLFSEALMKCLENDGGKTDQKNASGAPLWRVSTYSLSEALNAKVAEIRALKIDQEYYPIPRGQDMTIVNLDQPPQVQCTLEIDPEKAIPLVAVDLLDARGQTVWKLPTVKPHPYSGPLPAGLYTITAKISNPPQPPYVDFWDTVPVAPLQNSRLKAKVGP